MVATAALDHKVKGILKGLRYISQMFGKYKNQLYTFKKLSFF